MHRGFAYLCIIVSLNTVGHLFTEPGIEDRALDSFNAGRLNENEALQTIATNHAWLVSHVYGGSDGQGAEVQPADIVRSM